MDLAPGGPIHEARYLLLADGTYRAVSTYTPYVTFIQELDAENGFIGF